MVIQGRRSTIIKVFFFGTCCAALSLSFLIAYVTRGTAGGRQFWLMFLSFHIALLSSAIDLKRALLRQISIGLTTLIVLNLFSPLLPLIGEAPMITLPPDMVRKVRVVGDVMPGFHGVQTITTDHKGYRTNTPVDYDHKKPGALRIIAIGGSTTEQIYLDDGKTWTSLLAKHLAQAFDQPIEMINTGVSGLRASQNYVTLQDSSTYSPDIAIFMMGINDWDRQIRISKYGWISQTMDKLAFFSVTETVLYRALYLASSLIDHPKSADDQVAGQIREESGAYYSARNNSLMRKVVRRFQITAVSADYKRAVERISAECRSRHILCFYVNQPTAYDSTIEPALRRRLWMTPPDEEYTLTFDNMAQIAQFYNAWLEREATSNGLEFCDIAKYTTPTTEYFYDDCHFNESGARRVAALIAACMEPPIRRMLQNNPIPAG